MLTFVGLGLYEKSDVTVKGREAIEDAETVYAEFYTSALTASTEELEEFHGRSIEVLGREEVERGEGIVNEAKEEDVAFIVGGDPMVSTTHADLRLRAFERGVETRLVHAPSTATAVCGATGLQNYRFGASTTLPFTDDERDWEPESPFETVCENLERDLHTLVYLDISDDPKGEQRYMDASEAAGRLAESSVGASTAVGVARLGSDDTEVYAGKPVEVAQHDHGDGLHLLAVPASLHEVEKKTLEAIADLSKA